MAFDSFSEFLAMGGYGFFVWLSFGVTFVAMIAIVVESYMAQKQLLSQIQKEQARKRRIRDARSAI